MARSVRTLGRSAARALHRSARVASAAMWVRLAPRAARRLRTRQSWLLGGHSGTAYGDNAAALHQMLRAQRSGVSVQKVLRARVVQQAPRAYVLFRALKSTSCSYAR